MAAEGEHEDVVLEVMVVQPDMLDAWDVMEKKFEDSHPWIDLESVGVQENQSDFIVARAAADDLPAVLQTDVSEYMQALVDEGKILDVSDLPTAANFPDSYKDALTYNGVLVGYTQGAAFSVLFMNMDLLKQAGWDAAPTNYKELIQCCKDIEEKTDAAALTVAGNKTTTAWMVYECILANVCGEELGFGGFDEQILNGTFDFTKYSKATEMLGEISSFMMPGSSSMSEDDVTAAFADGSVAMAIAGNWTAASICDAIASATGDNPDAAGAVLIPFNEEGKDPWISASPETAIGLSAQEDPNVAEAAKIFLEWYFEPENYAIMQEVRGNVPVMTNISPDQVTLPDSIAKIVPAMNEANYVRMSFNILSTELFNDGTTVLEDVYAGNMKAEDAAKKLTDILKEHHVN